MGLQVRCIPTTSEMMAPPQKARHGGALQTCMEKRCSLCVGAGVHAAASRQERFPNVLPQQVQGVGPACSSGQYVNMHA